LPLLLIAFGLSAAGVGTFFEEYRPYFLAATFALLGSAWYFTYRTTIWRFWARRTGSPAPAAAGESCSQPPSAAAHSCCATDLEAESCCAQPAKAGQATRRRLTLHQFNQLMLWIATIIIVLLALFPSWIGLILGSTGSPPEGINLSDQEQVVVEIQGLSCAACAPAVEKALRNVPGVWAASVNYEKAQAVVLVPKGHDMPRAAILQAVHQAGYSATFRK
jgi:copper chaperone CopZ